MDRKIVLYEDDPKGHSFTGAVTDDGGKTFVIQQKSFLGETKQVVLTKAQLKQILKCEEVPVS